MKEKIKDFVSIHRDKKPSYRDYKYKYKVSKDGISKLMINYYSITKYIGISRFLIPYYLNSYNLYNGYLIEKVI